MGRQTSEDEEEATTTSIGKSKSMPATKQLGRPVDLAAPAAARPAVIRVSGTAST